MKYLYKKNNHIVGPIDEKDLKLLVKKEYLSQDDYIYPEKGYWKSIRDEIFLFQNEHQLSFFQKKSFFYLLFLILILFIAFLFS